MKNIVKVLLFVSVSINMFFIGFFVQIISKKPDRIMPPPPPPLLKMSSCSSIVSKPSYTEIKSHLKAIREIRKELSDALKKEPFDRDLVEKKFDKLIEEKDKGQKKFHTAIINSLEKMDKQERLNFIENNLFKRPRFERNKKDCNFFK